METKPDNLTNCKFEKSPGLYLLIRLAVVVGASFLVAFDYKSFVQAGDMFPGGFSGITRLIQRCAWEYLHIALPFGPINLLLNAIPAIISFKFIGKHFTLYSCLSIVLISVFTDLLPTFPITEDLLLISVFGGLFNGFALSLFLWVRVTAGGTDFIAIALSERKNVDAWNYIFCGNMVMLIIAGALFGWDRALYSIIFQYCTTQMIHVLDPVGKQTTLLIITDKEWAAAISEKIKETHHSGTLLEGTGLYNGKPRAIIYSVVDKSQFRRLNRELLEIDPNCFVNVLRSEKLIGNYYRRPRD